LIEKSGWMFGLKIYRELWTKTLLLKYELIKKVCFIKEIVQKSSAFWILSKRFLGYDILGGFEFVYIRLMKNQFGTLKINILAKAD